MNPRELDKLRAAMLADDPALWLVVNGRRPVFVFDRIDSARFKRSLEQLQDWYREARCTFVSASSAGELARCLRRPTYAVMRSADQSLRALAKRLKTVDETLARHASGAYNPDGSIRRFGSDAPDDHFLEERMELAGDEHGSLEELVDAERRTVARERHGR